jgi:hypothetical protein
MSIQRSFVEGDHVIEAFAANRANHAFHVGPLLGRAWCREDLLDCHRLHTLREITAEDGVPIA